MNIAEVEEQCERIMTLGSWTDQAGAELTLAVTKLTDPWALREAVDELIATWDTAFRPPIARVLALYRSKYEQRRLNEPQRSPLENLVVVPPERGYDIAMRAYVQDCKERGITVDVDKFHRIMGTFVGDRAARFREPERKGPGTPSARSGVLGSAAASPATSGAPEPAVHTPDR